MPDKPGAKSDTVHFELGGYVLFYPGTTSSSLYRHRSFAVGRIKEVYSDKVFLEVMEFE